MNDIFENAKFGDKFVTRDGKLALFDKKNNNGEYTLFLQDVYGNIGYKSDGTLYGNISADKTIVSRYQESIDEEKLDDLATIESGNFTKTDKFSDIVCNITYDLEQGVLEGYYNGFKAGYRKAKEE